MDLGFEINNFSVEISPLSNISMFPFFWFVEMVARSGSDSSSSVIKLDTVRRIAEQVTFSYTDSIIYI